MAWEPNPEDLAGGRGRQEVLVTRHDGLTTFRLGNNGPVRFGVATVVLLTIVGIATIGIGLSEKTCGSMDWRRVKAP